MKEQVYAHASEINGLSDSISIGGISAGGFWSCIIQQLARDAKLPLKLGKIYILGLLVETTRLLY
jgi:acetyl esterase/lipase